MTLPASWQVVQKEHPFSLIVLCLLPDHLHCIWKLSDKDADYSTKWQKIKEGFSRMIDRTILPSVDSTESNKSKPEVPTWQPRFWDHTIHNQVDYNRHFDYIHFNPVKPGYVQNAIEWPWLTFHRYLSQGIYNSDWSNIPSIKYNLSKTSSLDSVRYIKTNLCIRDSRDCVKIKKSLLKNKVHLPIS